MLPQLVLSKKHWDEMRGYVEQHMPQESCGLLAGKGHHVEKVLFVQNQAQSAVRYVMDPYEQLEAFEWIDAQGLELLGIFHSHPTGPETASATDIAEAAYEVVNVIWSCTDGKWSARGFWLADGQAINIPLVLSDE